MEYPFPNMTSSRKIVTLEKICCTSNDGQYLNYFVIIYQLISIYNLINNDDNNDYINNDNDDDDDDDILIFLYPISLYLMFSYLITHISQSHISYLIPFYSSLQSCSISQQ